MTTIREIAGDGSWTREVRQIDEGAPVPRGWTAAPLPEGTGNNDLVLWTGGAWIIAGTEQRARFMAQRLAPLAQAKLAEIADYRWQRQEAGVTVGGFPIKTDPESRSTITAAYFLAKGDPAMVRRWKVSPGVFVDLDAALMVAIGDAVLTYIQACFDRESELTDMVLAAADAGDAAALNAIDKTRGVALMPSINLGINVGGARGGTPNPAILLSGTQSILESAVSGTTVGTLSVSNGTGTYTFTKTADPDSKFSGTITAGVLKTSAALNYETKTSHNVTIQADNGAGSVLSQTFTIGVTNVLEVTLAALSLSATSYVTGVPSSGTINGATAGSTIAASGLPTGLTINGPARTWAWNGTGSVSTGDLTLTETHADGANSPNATVIAWSITNAAHNNHLLADNNDHLTADNGDYLLAA